MKIGIVTVYKSNNYGAYHQALALKRYLEEKGNEVYFIKHSARNPLISLLGKIYRAVLNKSIRGIPFILKQEWKFACSRREIEECSINQAKEMDTIILGSDEIWNIARKKIQNYPIFFGIGIENENMISYAPSVNNASEREFLGDQHIAEQLKKMKGISVRDSHSRDVIETVTGREVFLVADPTMLHDKKYYMNNIKDIDIKEPYILVYSYGTEEKMQLNEISKLKRFAKTNNLQIISVMGYLSWVDKNVSVCPDEIFGYFKNAAFVVTDTFHGTIFSLMMEKNFWILPTSSKKVEELLNMVDLGKRRLKYADEQDYTNKEMDYNFIKSKIDEMREKSIEFLDIYIS